MYYIDSRMHFIVGFVEPVKDVLAVSISVYAGSSSSTEWCTHCCRIVHMKFYAMNDMTLGQFLELYCFR